MSLDQAPPASQLLVATTSSQNIQESSSAGVQTTPAGLISDFGGLVAPDGWLLCDGTNVSRTTYSALFAVIGTLYGVGDGSSTFGLPDTVGRATVGFGAGGHTDVATVGNNDGVTLASRRPKHKHTVVQATITVATGYTGIHVQNAPGPNSAGYAASASGNSGDYTLGQRADGDPGHTHTATSTGNTVGPQTGAEPVDTPGYIVFPKIIKT